MTAEPVYSEAAIGYRSWNVAADGALPSTGLGSTRWRSGTNVAYCGLYARHDPPGGIEARAPWVAGAVALRGRVLVHHDGMRGEEAVILALAVPLDPHAADLRRVRAVADRYGVPLVAHDELRAEAERYGLPVPLADRPAPPPPVRRRGLLRALLKR